MKSLVRFANTTLIFRQLCMPYFVYQFILIVYSSDKSDNQLYYSEIYRRFLLTILSSTTLFWCSNKSSIYNSHVSLSLFSHLHVNCRQTINNSVCISQQLFSDGVDRQLQLYINIYFIVKDTRIRGGSQVIVFQILLSQIGFHFRKS